MVRKLRLRGGMSARTARILGEIGAAAANAVVRAGLFLRDGEDRVPRNAAFGYRLHRRWNHALFSKLLKLLPMAFQ